MPEFVSKPDQSRDRQGAFLSPPKLAEALLRRLVGGRDADAVAGDLAETYAQRGGGRFWYWRQALSCAAVRFSPHRRLLPGFGKDFAYALRAIRRNPSYALTAMLCLALAMGVTTTLFSFLDSIFFRELPVPAARRIVTAAREKPAPFCYLSEYFSIRDRLKSMDATAALLASTYIDIDRANLLLTMEIVPANYPRVLRLGTAAGRWFTADDSRAGESDVVISYHLWQSRLHGDPSVIGKRVVLQEQPFRIAGVAPQSFRGTAPPFLIDAWVTFAGLAAQAPPGALGPPVRLIGRLSDTATLQSAEAELHVIDGGLRSADPRDPRFSSPVLVRPATGFGVLARTRSDFLPILWLMAAVCAAVLLIACVNVANLLLSRAAVRRREIALRRALGAGRARLFRESLAEGLVLAAGGVALGVALGYWIGRILELALPSIPADLYGGIRFDIDWRVALFSAVTGIATAVLFSLPPALDAARSDPNAALKGDAEFLASRRRGLYSLVQVALSLTLLVSAALLLRALDRAGSADPGYATDHRLALNLMVGPRTFKPEAAALLLSSLLDQARAIPGVEDATLANAPIGPGPGESVSTSASGPAHGVAKTIIEPNFFDMMRIPILSGADHRLLWSAAPGDPPQLVINQTMARTLWPGEDPIGRPVWIGSKKRQLGEVVGMVRDTNVHGTGAPAAYYISRRQDPGNGQFALIIRTAGNPYQWSRQLMSVAANSDPRLRIYEMSSLADSLGISLWEVKWQAALLGALGLLAIGLAAIGLYCVVAYAVSQRTREIGIRMALGAIPADVQWMVLSRGLRITAAGIAVGLALSVAAVRFLRSFLYGLSPFDPVSFAAACLTWILIALLASWFPARRATRVDPLSALKYE